MPRKTAKTTAAKRRSHAKAKMKATAKARAKGKASPTKPKPTRPIPAAEAGSVPSHTPTRGLYGWITHTDLATTDPDATKAWCEKVLGWTFTASFPTAAGQYHLFAYSDKGGGGIRRNNPPETPGTLPYVHVADVLASFRKAVREGAEVMMPPEKVMDGVRVAIVRAPGGVAIGFSGPTEP
jgi:predicted enzyme related to lactoylglutathione lyase